MGGGGAPDAGKEEEKRQKQIRKGVSAIDKQFAMFDPAFYDRLGSSYDAFAAPQVDQQYKDASDQLQFALARQYGTTNTSEAASRYAKLAKAKADAEAQVADQRLGYQN